MRGEFKKGEDACSGNDVALVVTCGLTRFTRVFPCNKHITGEETIKITPAKWQRILKYGGILWRTFVAKFAVPISIAFGKAPRRGERDERGVQERRRRMLRQGRCGIHGLAYMVTEGNLDGQNIRRKICSRNFHF